MSEPHKNATEGEDIVAKGRIFELVQTVQPDGRVFEVARRAPGVRVIIANKAKEQILLTKEFRQELSDWDYRLPGGKVYDTLDDYTISRQKGVDIVEVAKQKAIAEAAEEAGFAVEDVELVGKSTLGATVERDLYIMEATTWRNLGEQSLERGEDISADEWFTFEQVEQMILEGKMQEERIALVLLRWINACRHA